MNKINSVCVYCASSTKIDSVYFDAARELGTLLGQKHIRLINGAGNMGLMSAVSDAVLQAGGKVTGVIPRFMVEQGWHHTGLTRLVEVESMHERKKTMADLSDAIIALPGGCGTLEELLECLGDRRVTLCRELTKKFETVTLTTLGQALADCEREAPRGEYVLVLAGRERAAENAVDLAQGVAMVLERRERGERMKDAVRQVAADTGLSRNELYDAALQASRAC